MIDGIGGAFLFSNDTKRLAAWYRDCLGIVPQGEDAECSSIYASFEYRDLANPEIKRTLAWAIMPTDQDIKDKPRTGQINYRVKNLKEVLVIIYLTHPHFFRYILVMALEPKSLQEAVIFFSNPDNCIDYLAVR